MQLSRWWIGLGIVVVTCGLSVDAEAQSRRGSRGWRLGVGSGFDVGGEVDPEGPRNDQNLRATFLFRGHADVGVFERRKGEALIGIALGPKVRMSWWEAKDAPFEDRSFLFDILFGVYLTVDWNDLRFKHGPALGMLISAVDDDVNLDNPAVGFVLDYTAAGVEWWFSAGMALFVDLGATLHFFTHDVDVGSGDVEMELRQMMMEGGIIFEL